MILLRGSDEKTHMVVINEESEQWECILTNVMYFLVASFDSVRLHFSFKSLWNLGFT
jgi:hypothetical protein